MFFKEIVTKAIQNIHVRVLYYTTLNIILNKLEEFVNVIKSVECKLNTVLSTPLPPY